MTTTTQSLSDWLLACVAEDEAVARQDPDGDTSSEAWLCDEFFHVAMGGPRVLAECESRRKIIELHRPDQDGLCTCPDPEGWNSFAQSPCPTLRALALPYRDRDGFREEWR